MKSLEPIDFLGATLTIVGSFLPWEREGGFPGQVINGIHFNIPSIKYWVSGLHAFRVYDYGGALVLLLTSAIVLLSTQPPKSIKNPSLWNLIITATLMVISLLFVGRWLIRWYEYSNTVEPPALMIGLIIVVLGSALLVWRAIIVHRQIAYQNNKRVG